MGLFNRLFQGWSTGDADGEDTEEGGSSVDVVTCAFCGDDGVPADQGDDDGVCDGCREVGDTRYCCGTMYQDREPNCLGCGEPFEYRD